MTHQIRIPHSDRPLYRNLTHQQAVHPPKGKLHVLDSLVFKVCSERSCSSISFTVLVEPGRPTIYALHQIPHALYQPLNTRLM